MIKHFFKKSPSFDAVGVGKEKWGGSKELFLGQKKQFCM